MDRFRSKITRIRVSTFWMSGKSTDSQRRSTLPSRPISFKPIMVSETPINPKNNIVIGAGRRQLLYSYWPWRRCLESKNRESWNEACMSKEPREHAHCFEKGPAGWTQRWIHGSAKSMIPLWMGLPTSTGVRSA